MIEANDSSNWLSSTDASATDFDSVATLQENASNRPDTIEPNVTLVKAPDLWNLGFTGTGIVVGNQDTGMRWTHDALKPHYRGWNGVERRPQLQLARLDPRRHSTLAAHEPVRIHLDDSVRRPRPRDAHDRYCGR